MDEFNFRKAIKMERDVLLHSQTEEKLRGTGRTTKLVDDYIQSLFRNKEVLVRDHHPSKEATRYLCDKLQLRMRHEFQKEVSVRFLDDIYAEIKLVEK